MWLFIGADVCVSRIQLCSERLLTVKESVECVVLCGQLTQVLAYMAGTHPSMDYTQKSKTRESRERKSERQRERGLD